MRLLVCLLFCFCVSDVLALPSYSDFAKHEVYREAVISPTGEYLAVNMAVEDGYSAIAVLRLSDLEWMANVRLSKKTVPFDLIWVNDERVMVQRAKTYFGDKRPYPNGELFAMNFDGSRQENLIDNFRPFVVSGDAEYANHLVGFAEPINLLPDDPRHIVIHFKWWTRKESNQKRELYKLDVYTGKVEWLAESVTDYAWFLTDKAGHPTYSWGSESYDDVVLHQYVDGEWRKLDHSLVQQKNEGFVQWQPVSNIHGTSELIIRVEGSGVTDAFYRADIETGEQTLLYQHQRVDADSLLLDKYTNEPYAVRTDHHFPKVELLNAEHPVGKWYPSLQKAFEGQVVIITGATKDAKLLSFKVYSDRNPGTNYLFDTEKKAVKTVFSTSPWIKPDAMSPTLPFDFKNREGDLVSGYYTAPEPAEGKLPLVVLPHGGPHQRDSWGFDSDVQFLASRGYGVLQVNFRGSTGYGYDFQEAGRQRWGDVIQNDIIDATRWIIDQGLVDKNRICIFGASFGGYAALMAPTIEPELFKCAVGYAGVYDLNLMWEKGDIQDRRWGEDALEEILGTDKQKMAEFSPINRLDKLTVPVLLIHGAQDERAHIAQYNNMKKALEKRNHPLETLLVKNEGHGFYDEDNRIKLYKKLEQFLAKHIGKEGVDLE